MKAKEIERALEIVYWNRDKFKLVKSSIDTYTRVSTNQNSIMAAYQHPYYYINLDNDFIELLNYDNRT
jgi:hypothetical protein